MITSARTGELALTVAVRGAWCTSAISPKKSPAFSEATLRLFFRTSAEPSTRTKNSRPPLPSQLFPFLEVDLVGDAADRGEVTLRTLCEQRYSPQQVDLRILTQAHGVSLKREKWVRQSW
jgi:hypothetical protein